MRLVLSEELQESRVQYTALSHCWGNLLDRPWLLLGKNLNAYKKSISHAKMPLSFRDAIDITRGLGYNYVWIDSLCIIQDNQDDWTIEASRMADVYEGAICTICATSAGDSEKGCRVNAGGKTARAAWLSGLPSYTDINTANGYVRLFYNAPKEWFEQYYNVPLYIHAIDKPAPKGNPLNQRAWAFQERELSLRMIHFSEHGLLWECSSLRASNDVPWAAFTHRVEGTDWSIRTIGLRHLDRENDLRSTEEWVQIVRDYTARRLTEEKDKLPAFAGIAARFQLLVPESRYLAGIWSSHLPWALTWQVDHRWNSIPSYYPKHTRSPSWSWVSVEGCISQDAMTTSFIALQDEPASRKALCEVLSVICQPPSNGNVFGIVESKAQISIEGCVTRFRISDEEQGYRDQNQRVPCKTVTDSSGNELGLLIHDVLGWEGEPQAIDGLYCLSVCIDCGWKSFSAFNYGLLESDPEEDRVLALGLIEARESDQQVFKRVGLVRGLSHRLFQAVKPTPLIIV